MYVPKISIIVPVYKVEQFLSRCVDSILAQTFKEFELLLIDDGSPDDSGKICDEYANKDSRIRVFHKENGGVSSARNIGLDNARGEWIVFVDSDDWVSSLYIQELYTLINDNKNGVVIQGYLKVVEEKNIPQIQNEQFYPHSKFHQMFDEHQLCRIGMPWAKLYYMPLIKKYNLKFDEKIHYSEDLIFLFNYIYYADWVQFSDSLNYYYIYDNPTSLLRSYNSFESEWIGYKSFKYIVDSLQIKYKVAETEMVFTKKWVLYFAMRSIKTIYRKGKNHLKYKERIYLLKNEISYEDKIFMMNYQQDLNSFDKLVCYLLIHQKYILADCFLNLFYKLRYSKIAMILMK